MNKRKLIAVFCTLLVCVIAMTSCLKVDIVLPEITTGQAAGQNLNNPIDNTTAAIQLPEITTQPIIMPPVTEAVTTAPIQQPTQPAQQVPQSEPATQALVPKTPLEMNNDELIEYFNKNLNDVKVLFPGFNRTKITNVADIVLSNQAANTLVGFVKGALLSEEAEEKTATKGSSCMEIMSPDGERFVSQITSADIKGIEVSQSGENYVVTVHMNDELNPTKESSPYAKIFNFITVDDVVNIYAPKVGATVNRENIKVAFSGCYAKATFAPDGKVVEYETYVKGVMSLLDASIKKVITINTDVDITLASTTKFTNFVY